MVVTVEEVIEGQVGLGLLNIKFVGHFEVAFLLIVFLPLAVFAPGISNTSKGCSSAA